MKMTKEAVIKAYRRTLVGKYSVYILPEENSSAWNYENGEWLEMSNDSYWDFYESEIMLAVMKPLEPEEVFAMLPEKAFEE